MATDYSGNIDNRKTDHTQTGNIASYCSEVASGADYIALSGCFSDIHCATRGQLYDPQDFPPQILQKVIRSGK
jgi:hypothetical protein